MRLKNLKIKGFKSFADETEVHFDQPIIGIVGPNGSGKSNIVDSIRWVLGEQKSKDLRLDKMTDVIFNGSKKRKSSGLAQVTLTFENTKNLIPIEFDEVAITRILYADSSSEYRINNVKCRRKDIIDLFLDSGIGSNSYAIIELKMVDDILIDKDRARLRMFEQAAGISKYKTRKHETLNKLKNTEGDLDRVEDILFELEASLKELKKQAGRAQKFNDLKDKYKSQSIKLAYYEIHSTADKKQKIELEIQEQTQKYEQATTEKRTVEATLESIKLTNLDKEKSLSVKQEEFNGLIEQTRNNESKKEVLTQKIELNQKSVQQNKSRIEVIEGDMQQLISDIQNLNVSSTTAVQELALVSSKAQEITDRYNSIKSERDAAQDVLTNAQNALMTKQKKIFDLEKAIALKENQIDSQSNFIKNQQTRIDEIIRITTDDAKEDKEISDALKSKEIELNEIIERITKEESSNQKLEEERKVVTQKLTDQNRKLDSKTNELALLQDMIDKMEGFPESIKFLSNYWKKSLPLLQDIIDVQEAYKPAVEQFLEPYLNYFVASNYTDAYKSVKLLTEAQKGKSQIFILSEMDKGDNSLSALAGTQSAIDILDYDAKYEPLFRHLFHNVFIAEPGTKMEGLAVPKGMVVISADGSIVKSKYSLRGGSIGIFEGKKIGRVKNVEKLKKQIKEIQIEIDTLNKRLEGLDQEASKFDLDQTLLKKAEIESAFKGLQIRHAEIRTTLGGFETQVNDLEARVKAADQEVLNFKEQLKELVSGLQNANLELQSSKDGDDISEDSFAELNTVFEQASQLFNDNQIQIIRAQAKSDNIASELGIKNEQKASQELRMVNYRDEIERLEREISENQTELSSLNQELEDLYGKKKAEQLKLSEHEQNYFAEKSTIIEEEKKAKKIDTILQAAQITINEAKSRLQNILFATQSIAERLHIEFNIQIDQIDGAEYNLEEEINLQESKIKLDRLRARLENFGEINPLALQAYDEMLSRYEMTVTQRDDIIKAKESLLETISEIEEKATTKFHEAFDQIRVNFKDVFRSLFTEDDDCDLVLLNPDKPLESEIEIIAKPKGKRPKVLKQLSGGEKTLTATALLFSLYLLKPAPFCIFDEVDAPLDDTNIAKFNKLIRKFSKESQFIIITHNKATMAKVDVLYGIFLKEEGVSGLAPVDFRNLEFD